MTMLRSRHSGERGETMDETNDCKCDETIHSLLRPADVPSEGNVDMVSSELSLEKRLERLRGCIEGQHTFGSSVGLIDV